MTTNYIEFKKNLKKKRQTLKWFYDNFIKEKTGLTYSGFAGQLNGYAPVSDDVEEELIKHKKLFT